MGGREGKVGLRGEERRRGRREMYSTRREMRRDTDEEKGGKVGRWVKERREGGTERAEGRWQWRQGRVMEGGREQKWKGGGGRERKWVLLEEEGRGE
eukprot:3193158-Rhodomonas_salina.2